MSTLIVYATKHGTTEKAVERLEEMLSDAIDKVNIGKERINNIEEYDCIVIGGSIHMGNIQKKIRKFIKANEQLLITKKIGLFLCCMRTDQEAEDQFNAAYPEILRNQAIATELFGGEFIISKMSKLDKMIIEKVSGETEDSSSLNVKVIERFAKKINDQLVLER